MGKLTDKFARNKPVTRGLDDYTKRMINADTTNQVSALLKSYYPILKAEKAFWDGLNPFQQYDFLAFKEAYYLNHSKTYLGIEEKFATVCAPPVLVEILKYANGNSKLQMRLFNKGMKYHQIQK